MTLEELCLYKKLEQNEESTTFRDIRDNEERNPSLYACISCNGYKASCDNYTIVKR